MVNQESSASSLAMKDNVSLNQTTADGENDASSAEAVNDKDSSLRLPLHSQEEGQSTRTSIQGDIATSNHHHHHNSNNNNNHNNTLLTRTTTDTKATVEEESSMTSATTTTEEDVEDKSHQQQRHPPSPATTSGVGLEQEVPDANIEDKADRENVEENLQRTIASPQSNETSPQQNDPVIVHQSILADDSMQKDCARESPDWCTTEKMGNNHNIHNNNDDQAVGEERTSLLGGTESSASASIPGSTVVVPAPVTLQVHPTLPPQLFHGTPGAFSMGRGRTPVQRRSLSRRSLSNNSNSNNIAAGLDDSNDDHNDSPPPLSSSALQFPIDSAMMTAEDETTHLSYNESISSEFGGIPWSPNDALRSVSGSLLINATLVEEEGGESSHGIVRDNRGSSSSQERRLDIIIAEAAPLEEHETTLPANDERGRSQTSSSWWWSKSNASKGWFLALVVVAMLSLMVAMVLVVLRWRPTTTNNIPSAAPSRSATPSSTPLITEEEFLVLLPDFTREAILQPFTPQHQVFNNLVAQAFPDGRSEMEYVEMFVLGMIAWIGGTESRIDLSALGQEEPIDYCTLVPITCAHEFFGVERLLLSNFRIEGLIPREIGILEYLTHLDLSVNRFGRTLPKELSWLSKLQVLNLHDNELTGFLVDELALLNQTLKVVTLHNNEFTGTIPESWAALLSLEVLTLHGNDQLSGTVPAGVCQLVDQGLNLTIDCDAVQCPCACSCM